MRGITKWMKAIRSRVRKGAHLNKDGKNQGGKSSQLMKSITNKMAESMMVRKD
jgi:hypothetical protein